MQQEQPFILPVLGEKPLAPPPYQGSWVNPQGRLNLKGQSYSLPTSSSFFPSPFFPA